MIDYIPSATRYFHESFLRFIVKKLFEALKDDNQPLLRIGDVT